MEIPASLLGAVATEGEIFFFEKCCPVGNLTRRGLIHREVGGGTIPEADMIRIREGIDLSVNISDEDKDRILR